MNARLASAGIAAIAAWAVLLMAAPTGLTSVCGAGGLVRSVPAWDVARLLSLGAMWGVMSAAMMLPCLMAMRSDRIPASELILVTVGGAFAHWLLESAGILGATGAVESVPLQIGLLLVIGLAEVAKWQRRSAIAALVQMVCLQFVGGAMDLGWMAVVTLWMVVDAMLHRQATHSRPRASSYLRASASLSPITSSIGQILLTRPCG